LGGQPEDEQLAAAAAPTQSGLSASSFMLVV
jgi:hypothetical protein